MNEASPEPIRVIGRYALHAEIAAGGMAKVHLGRLLGPVGFARTVAIKRLHADLARDPEFVAMFLDEARLAARIRHPNVVSTLDVVAQDKEIFLVLEYVVGEPLSRLIPTSARRDEHIAPEIVASIIVGVLEGLHAAHEARSENGAPLGIVHRDVSPQNVIVGTDGVARVLDFGIAKATVRIQETQDGQLKGKMAYVSPEQAFGRDVDRRADLWAAGVVLWEMLARRRLFHAESPVALLQSLESDVIARPSLVAPCSAIFDDIVLRALERDPDKRFATAREMALAIEGAAEKIASARTVGEWVERISPASLASRAAKVEEMEKGSASDPEMRRSQTVESRLAMLGVDPMSGEASIEAVAIPAEATGPARGRPPEPVQPGTEKMAVRPSAPPIASVPVEPPARRRTSPALVGSVITLVVALGFLAFVAIGKLRAPAPVPDAPPLPIESASSAALSPAPTTEPSITPLPIASVTPPSSAPHGKRPVVVGGRRPATTKGPACDPPYTIGPAPDFIRRPKPECFPE